MKYKCLSIAGFDSSGGAGIQAALKTFSATGSYGLTVCICKKSCHDSSKRLLHCVNDYLSFSKGALLAETQAVHHFFLKTLAFKQTGKLALQHSLTQAFC